MPNPYTNYRRELIDRFWGYSAEEFPDGEELLDDMIPNPDRPPVFNIASASQNVITIPSLTKSDVTSLHQMIPPEKRHRWFRSMSSSQALAQSVFGTLSVLEKASLLEALETEEGHNPFVAGRSGSPSIELEVEVQHFGEPRRTSLDVLFHGARQIGIEVKLTERKVGACSRPNLKPDDPQRCNGNYSIQIGRHSRCSLTEIGVHYWEHVPKLFRIDSGVDHTPCPLKDTYQIIRNVLGVCVLPDGSVSPDGQVILLFDDRNPAFQVGGLGVRAFDTVRNALLEPWRLQRCTWQKLAMLLRGHGELDSLTNQLMRKYGF